MRFGVGGAAALSAVAALVGACQAPSPFKSADAARGAYLAARMITQVGPECAKAFSYYKFNLERARDDETAAGQYLRHAGLNDDQLQRLANASEVPADFGEMVSNSPGDANEACDALWQRLPRYRLPAEKASAELPPPVSEKMLAQQAADQAQLRAKAEASRQAAEAARRAADQAMNEALQAEKK